MKGSFVAYYRVSTTKQGESGLGLEAQKAAVLQYLNGGDWTLLDEFVEVESGKRKNRPQLDAALALCRKKKATLIIAKLDRLARNLHFISGLMEARIEFLAVDNPTANRLTVQILAAVAEEEARAISARTKAALASAKARGTVLGKFGKELAAKNRNEAVRGAMELKPTIDEIRGRGVKSIRGISAELMAKGVLTPQGKKVWHIATVQRVLKNIELGSNTDGESPERSEKQKS